MPSKLLLLQRFAGIESKPGVLKSVYGVAPAHVMLLRCMRMLAAGEKPAMISIPQLEPVWARDTPRMKDKAKRLGPRALHRVVSFLFTGWTCKPTKYKSALSPDAAHARLFSRIFHKGDDADADETVLHLGEAHGETTVNAVMRYTSAAGPQVDERRYSARAFREAVLDWALYCHEKHDREARPFAPSGTLPVIATDVAPADTERLHMPEHNSITIWHGVKLIVDSAAPGASAVSRRKALVSGGSTVDGAAVPPLRVQLALRGRAHVTGRPRAELYEVAFFATPGLPTILETFQSSNTVAVLNRWNARPEERAALTVQNTATVTLSDTLEVRNGHLTLNAAIVCGVDELQAAGARLQVPDEDWARETARLRAELPWRVATIAQLHSGMDVLADKTVLDHDAPLPDEWCLCILKEAARKGKQKVDMSSCFVDLDTVLELNISRGRFRSVPMTVATGATMRPELAKLNKGKGLYFFKTASIAEFMRPPGDYTLSFSAASVEGAELRGPVEPLTLTLRRQQPPPPPMRRALDPSCVWQVCVHPGECDIVRKTGACRIREAALARAACDLVLGGAAMLSKLHVVQIDNNERPVAFPVDVAEVLPHLHLEVWYNASPTPGMLIEKQLPVEVRSLAVSDVRTDDEGALVLKNIRLRDAKLPSAFVNSPAPISALLRVCLEGARTKIIDPDVLGLTGGCEFEVRVLPGAAARIALCRDWPLPDAGHLPGAEIKAAFDLEDTSGNRTTRLHDGSPATSIAAEMRGLALPEGANRLPLNAAGKAEACFTVTALYGEFFKAREQAASDCARASLTAVYGTAGEAQRAGQEPRGLQGAEWSCVRPPAHHRPRQCRPADGRGGRAAGRAVAPGGDCRRRRRRALRRLCRQAAAARCQRQHLRVVAAAGQLPDPLPRRPRDSTGHHPAGGAW